MKAAHANAGEIAEAVSKKRQELTEQLNSGSGASKPGRVPNQSQQALLAKQKHMETFKSALKISSEHKFGEAFDVELQELKLKQKLLEKE